MEEKLIFILEQIPAWEGTANAERAGFGRGEGPIKLAWGCTAAQAAARAPGDSPPSVFEAHLAPHPSQEVLGLFSTEPFSLHVPFPSAFH